VFQSAGPERLIPSRAAAAAAIGKADTTRDIKADRAAANLQGSCSIDLADIPYDISAVQILQEVVQAGMVGLPFDSTAITRPDGGTSS